MSREIDDSRLLYMNDLFGINLTIYDLSTTFFGTSCVNKLQFLPIDATDRRASNNL